MTYIAGFICALVLAAFVIVWITYCMFCKERHKSEAYQYNICDLRKTNYEVAQDHESQKKEVVAGIIMLPARKRHTEDLSYKKRPDYPETTLGNLQPGTEKLIEIFNDNTLEADGRKCVGFDLDSNMHYHSDV